MFKAWFRIRQLVTIFLMVSLPMLTLYPAEAQALSAGSAFNSLLSNVDTSTTAPGYYQTEARGAFVAGGFDVHFANNNFQLINITPPSFSAGCGGISMFFGGFSFISGAQFSALVQNILQAAIGYAIQLAIQTLCPACEAVLQVLQKAAQLANELANNTCQLAQDLVNKGANLLGLNAKGGASDTSQDADAIWAGKPSQCAQENAGTGGGSGFLSSINSGICQFSASASADMMSMWNGLGGSGATKQADKHSNQFGNLTYIALRTAGATSWETIDVLMSLMGTSISAPQASCKGSTSCPSPVTPKQPITFGGISKTLRPLVFDYMCGTSETAALEANPDNVTFCQNLAGSYSVNGNAWAYLNTALVYYCSGHVTGVQWPTTDIQGMNTLGSCSVMHRAAIGAVAGGMGTQPQWSSFAQEGFLAYVSQTLQTAVNDVSNNQPLSSAAIQLIQEAPFPLYQIIDLAAVYPDTASQMVTAASQTIALLLTERMLVEVMDNVSTAAQASNADIHTISMTGVIHLLSSIRTEQQSVTQRALVLSTYELQMMSEVRQVERLIQDQVLQQGVMGNEQYTQALMSGLTLGSGPNS